MKLLDTQLPAGWTWEPISARYRITKKPKGRSYLDFETIPFVAMESVPSNGQERVRYESRRPNEIASGTYFEKGDVLLSKITPSFENGKQALANNIPAPFGVASTEIIPLQAATTEASNRFLFFYFLHPEVRAALTGKMEGSTGRQRVPEHVVRDFLLPTPQKSEQEKISAVLWKIQCAIETEEKLIATLRELKQSAMQQLFSCGLRGESQKETEIGSIPKSWRTVPLSEVVTARGGFPFPHAKQGKKSGAYPFYKVSDMNLAGNELCMNAAINWIDDEDLKLLKAKTFPSEAVIFPKVGGAIFTNKKRMLTRPSVIDNNLMGVVVLDAKFCLPEFLYQWLVSIDLRALANPGPLPSINGSRLYETIFPLPKPDEQRDIVRVLNAIDRKNTVHVQKRANLQELFKTMLHQLMTGQIRVANLDVDVSEIKS